MLEIKEKKYINDYIDILEEVVKKLLENIDLMLKKTFKEINIHYNEKDKRCKKSTK